ncbi:MAG: polysaccharide biosynthesis protein [Spirochaetales bacterium]|nr:polysaccharide biosynthesis protein [Spirochaetales bacterium]
MSNKLNLLKKFITYIPGHIVPAFFTFLSAYIFTRIFNENDYGFFILILSVINPIRQVIGNWLQQSTARFIPMVKTKDELKSIKIIIVFNLWAITITTTILGIFTYIIVGEEFKQFILPACLIIIGLDFFDTFNNILMAESRATAFMVNKLINSILTFGFRILLIFLLYQGISGLIWGMAIAPLIYIPIMWVQTEMPHPLTILNKELLATLKTKTIEFLKYGLPMAGYVFAAALLEIGDRYILQFMYGTSAVGEYSASYQLINGGALLLIAPIHLTFYPFLMKYYNKNDKASVGKILAQIIEVFLFFGILITGLIYLFSKDIALFLGEEFREAHVVMPFVFAGVILWHCGLFVHKPIEFNKKTYILFITSMAAAALNFLLNLFMIKQFGYMGAAYTTFLSYLFYLFVTGYIGRKFLPWKLNLKKMIIQIFFIGISVAILFFVKYYFETHFSYFLSIIITLIFASIFFIILIYYVFKTMIKNNK